MLALAGWASVQALPDDASAAEPTLAHAGTSLRGPEPPQTSVRLLEPAVVLRPAAGSLPSPALVRQVNRAVNERTRYVSDEKLYGRQEFWTVADGEGDCEDYALAKRAMLLEAGVDPLHMRLMTAWIASGEYHLVLVAQTTRGEYVLDARQREPMTRQALEARGYRWHLIEEKGRWFAVR